MDYASKSHGLQVPRPCPFVPTNRNRNEHGFYCKSCAKTVVDLRGGTALELANAVNEKACGIFDGNQLTAQKSMSSRRRMIFHCLALLSILGFSIGPVAAQTGELAKDSVVVESGENKVLEGQKLTKGLKKEKHRRRGLFRRKKKNAVVIGCPSF